MEKKHLINNFIRAQKVLLLDDDGNKIGLMPFEKAIEQAYTKDLDLMQLNETDGVAVCKIVKYDSWLYHEKKRKEKQEFKNRSQDMKIIQLRPVTGEHDFLLKLKKINEFLNENHKVKVVVKFKNYRETTMKSVNDEIINKIIAGISESGELDGNVTYGGKEISIMLRPGKKSQPKPKMN